MNDMINNHFNRNNNIQKLLTELSLYKFCNKRLYDGRGRSNHCNSVKSAHMISSWELLYSDYNAGLIC
ncbi:hypothetical protein RCL_jg23289.t1 [Rhizophagus clarus]|uniref:Uncharacterized protein n=1 Tax=Rhizophagus clarus TaxID=94130 RepID=A0A8H3QH59_9GLOM|nr:hypothetical protein RCL_jg23289.t1 [Rhizophagus clarus]